MAKKVFASVPDAVAKDLDEWSRQQGRSMSNLIAYLLENSVRAAKEQGDFVPEKSDDTTDTTESSTAKPGTASEAK